MKDYFDHYIPPELYCGIAIGAGALALLLVGFEVGGWLVRHVVISFQ